MIEMPKSVLNENDIFCKSNSLKKKKKFGENQNYRKTSELIEASQILDAKRAKVFSTFFA